MRAGDIALGVSLTLTDPIVAEIVGAAGHDFVMIDTQHAPVHPESLQHLLMALRSSRSTTLVRVVSNDPVAIGQALDLGAEGVIVPDVVSADACRAAVSAARYAPAGSRGFGPRRAARLEGGRAAYLSRANEEVGVVAMVEHADAVEHIDEILTTSGLDAVMVGPADLAVSLGHLTDLGNPAVEDAIEVVRAACLRHGVPFGIFAAAEAAARTWAARGAAFMTIGADLQFLDHGLSRSSALATELRNARR